VASVEKIQTLYYRANKFETRRWLLLTCHISPIAQLQALLPYWDMRIYFCCLNWRAFPLDVAQMSYQANNSQNQEPGELRAALTLLIISASYMCCMNVFHWLCEAVYLAVQKSNTLWDAKTWQPRAGFETTQFPQKIVKSLVTQTFTAIVNFFEN
jgi:hypothetical protein